MTRVPEVELIDRLCDDLTKDIRHMENKQWLIPSLVAHILTLTASKDKDTVEQTVYAWFRKVTGKAY